MKREGKAEEEFEEVTHDCIRLASLNQAKNEHYPHR